MKFKHGGLQRVLYTDIARDGMLVGPALESTKELAIATGLSVTASGGISSKEDLEALRTLEAFGVDSVIVGRAFYEGLIKPEEVL
jgi:phosphoribosylformimino-5-aminoimidazole carboxamide ribotide isomerase